MTSNYTRTLSRFTHATRDRHSCTNTSSQYMLTRTEMELLLFTMLRLPKPENLGEKIQPSYPKPG
ncbi:MAG: hypothetical protein WBD58_19750 [Geitlerinemataceae cyanobacterium]